ncbi:MAG: thioesterase [Eubacteriales bacterium]|nr:thioesterase [Eubacteriales bacterium]
MYEFTTRTRYSELDENGNMKLLSLLNYLQDTIEFNGIEIGMTTAVYKELHRAWFITAWDIYISSRPSDIIDIIGGTSPHNTKGFFANRNFWLRYGGEAAPDDSNFIIKADSLWFLVNTDTLQPVRISGDDLKPYGELKNVLDLSIKSRKVAVKPDAAAGEELNEIAVMPVRREMIDSNHHVNNIRYIAAAFDALIDSGTAPADFFPSHIRAEYRQAARLGDTFVISCIRRTSAEADPSRITYLLELKGIDDTVYCHVELS